MMNGTMTRLSFTRLSLALTIPLLACAMTVGETRQASAADGFTITSPAFKDNDLLDRKFAAKGGPRNCDGENVSPPLAWSNVPAGTKSFAIVTNDLAGRHGLGVVHWIAYDIPASTTSLPEGAASGELKGMVGGKNLLGMTKYFGPCPDVGDTAHHYEFMIVALSVEPGKLAAGLDFAGLMAAIKDNTLGATSIIGRYAREKK